MARKKGKTARRGARRKRKASTSRKRRASTYRKRKPAKAPQESNKRRKKDEEGNFDEAQKHEEKPDAGKTCNGRESYATEDEESMTAETYDSDSKKGKRGRSSESMGRGQGGARTDKRRAGSRGSGVAGGSGKTHSKPQKNAKDISKHSDSKRNETNATKSMTTSTKDNKTKGEAKGQKGKNSRKKKDIDNDEGSSSSG